MITLNEERKKLYLYTMMNLLSGIILGIVLFYANMRSGAGVSFGEYYYDKTVGFSEVVRAWWANIMWMMSAFLAHSILSVSFLHIIVWVRGMASGFSVLYLLESFGIKEALSSSVPQCVSALPILIWFSVNCVQKKKELCEKGISYLILKRRDTAIVFLLSMVAAIVEIGVFKLFCCVLF